MPNEQKRLEELMKYLDRATAEAFLAYVSTMKSDAMIREVERLLRLDQITEAISLIESHLRKFATVIPANYTRVANSTITSLEGIRPRIAITFNPAHPRAASDMSRQSLRLISDISNSQRESIRNALTEAFQEGAGPRQAARAYRDAIGLTETQRQAVNRYRALLEMGNSEALRRRLADKRFNLNDLDPSKIDRMVDAYTRNYVKYRSEVIARTETTETLNAANEEAFAQTMEQADIGDDYIERTWQFTHDGRTRDSHRNMTTRVVRGLQTPFVTGLGNRALRPGSPELPAEDKIQCRCTVTHRILRAEEVTG